MTDNKICSSIAFNVINSFINFKQRIINVPIQMVLTTGGGYDGSVGCSI